MDKEKTLGECEVTPSGMGDIRSLTINAICFTSCPIAFGKWIAYKKITLHYCTLEGESAESAVVQSKKKT